MPFSYRLQLTQTGADWIVIVHINEEPHQLRPLATFSSSFGLFDEKDKCKVVFHGHLAAVKCCAIYRLPNGRPAIVSGSDDKTLRCWSIDTGEPIGDPLSFESGRIVACSIYPQATKVPAVVAVLYDGTLLRWDLQTRNLLWTPLVKSIKAVKCCAIYELANGAFAIVLGGRDKFLHHWNLHTNTLIGTIEHDHKGEINCCTAYKLNNLPRIATGGDDKSVRIWDPLTGKRVGEPLLGHTKKINCCDSAVINETPFIISGSKDTTLRFWNGRTGKLVLGPLEGHQDDVSSCAIYKKTDGRFAAISGGGYLDQTLRLWDLKTGKQIGEPQHGHTHSTMCCTNYTQNTTIFFVTGSADQNLLRWDSKTGAPKGDPLKGHTDPILCCLVYNENVLVSGGRDNILRQWDVFTGADLNKPLIGHTAPVTCCAHYTSTDGTPIIVSSGYDQTIRFWNALTGKQIGESVEVRIVPVWCCATYVQADGKPLIAFGDGGDGRNYDPEIEFDPFHDTPGTLLLWSPDTGLKIYNEIIILPKEAGAINRCTFYTLPGDATPAIATAGADYKVRLWNALTGAPIIVTLEGQHTASVNCIISYQQDDGTPIIVSGDDKRTLLFRNAITGRLRYTPFNLPEPPVAMMLLEKQLVVQLRSGNRVIIQLSAVPSLLELAGRAMEGTNTLTPEQTEALRKARLGKQWR